jgi:hypothetical protein
MHQRPAQVAFLGFNGIEATTRVNEMMGTQMKDPLHCSTEDYRRILMEIRASVSPTHRRLLKAHLHSPSMAASTEELSVAMGWKGNAANVHYGRFAGLLEPFIVRPAGADKLYLIADFDTESRKWKLRLPFAEAVRGLSLAS